MTYQIGQPRGVIRQGATSADPKGRYCANLGHVEDDESGLTYMRARYYEPSSGRFVSEDSERDGANWFNYCESDPVNQMDIDGHASIDWTGTAQAALFGMIIGFCGVLGYNLTAGPNSQLRLPVFMTAAFSFLVGFLGRAIGQALGGRAHTMIPWNQWISQVAKGGLGGAITGDGIGMVVSLYYGIRSGQILYELFEMDYEDMGGH